MGDEIYGHKRQICEMKENRMKKTILILILIVLAVSAFCFAADEIIAYGTPGESYYCFVDSGKTRWDGTSAYTDTPVWADAAIELTENASIPGQFTASFPASPQGKYTIPVYLGTKATASDADGLAGGLDYAWSGTAEITPATVGGGSL